MARTMVDKIRETEQRGHEIISGAELTANELLKQAEDNAKEMTLKATKQADADSEKIVVEARTDAEAVAANAERRGWTEGEKLSAKADKNRDAAVKEVIDIIFS